MLSSYICAVGETVFSTFDKRKLGHREAAALPRILQVAPGPTRLDLKHTELFAMHFCLFTDVYLK